MATCHVERQAGDLVTLCQRTPENVEQGGLGQNSRLTDRRSFAQQGIGLCQQLPRGTISRFAERALRPMQEGSVHHHVWPLAAMSASKDTSGTAAS